MQRRERSVLLLGVLLGWLAGAGVAGERGEEPYLIVPADYTPAKSWPVMLVGQNQVSAAQMADKPYFAMYCGPGAACKAPLIELAGKYNIDPYRVYATAFSRTGHAALEAAYTYPGWFAAIAPIDEDMRFKEGRAVQKIEFLKYIRTPTLMLHGDHDSFRKTGRKNFESMTAAGCPVTWGWFKGGHNPDPIYFKDVQRLIDFFEKHKVDPYPKDVLHVITRPDATRAWWVDCTVVPEATGKQDAPVYRVRVTGPNRIAVEADEAVCSLELTLNDRLVDTAKPVRVVMGERSLHEGPARDKLVLTLRESKTARQGDKAKFRPLWEDLEAIRSGPSDTGAHDWVYLEMATKQSDPRLGRDVARSLSLDLGLRLADAPATAKITPDSKRFARMDLAAAKPRVRVDMAAMRHRLPVAVEATSKTFDLTTDPVGLAPAGEGKGGQVVLVDVRLVHQGREAVVGRMKLYRAPTFSTPRPMWPAADDTGGFAAGLHEVASTRKISNQWAPRMGMFPYQSLLWLSLNPDGKLPPAAPLRSSRWRAIWGVRRALKLPPGQTLSLPLLLISAPAPDAKAKEPTMPGLAAILDSIKPAVLKALSAR